MKSIYWVFIIIVLIIIFVSIYLLPKEESKIVNMYQLTPDEKINGLAASEIDDSMIMPPEEKTIIGVKQVNAFMYVKPDEPEFDQSVRFDVIIVECYKVGQTCQDNLLEMYEDSGLTTSISPFEVDSEEITKVILNTNFIVYVWNSENYMFAVTSVYDINEEYQKEIARNIISKY